MPPPQYRNVLLKAQSCTAIICCFSCCKGRPTPNLRDFQGDSYSYNENTNKNRQERYRREPDESSSFWGCFHPAGQGCPRGGGRLIVALPSSASPAPPRQTGKYFTSLRPGAEHSAMRRGCCRRDSGIATAQTPPGGAHNSLVQKVQT